MLARVDITRHCEGERKESGKKARENECTSKEATGPTLQREGKELWEGVGV